MKYLRKCIVAILVLLIPFMVSGRQKEAVTLELGQAVKGELLKETPMDYSFRVGKGQFVLGYVDQISVDVVVIIYDSKKEKVAEFDNPARGREYFSFETKSRGEYRIEVKPFEQNEGLYSIGIEASEPIAKDGPGKIDQLLMQYDNELTAGGVVGVVHDGKFLFKKGYGMANLVHDIPFTTDLKSNIGSVSKQFTAMAILLLERQGKLSTDDDLRKHLPELPDFGHTITLRNLLSHTNGLREVYNTIPMKGWYGEDVLRREEVIRLIQNQDSLQNLPDEAYNYNNSAFIFLAEIVERVTGEKFPKWVKSNIFEPLGMSHTLVRGNPKEIVPGSAQGYISGDDGYVEAGDLHAAYGAGGIYTTLDDLVKWLGNFKVPIVGDHSMIEKLVTPGILTNGDTLSYALGIGVLEYRGQKVYRHSGADIAHRAWMTYFPDMDVGIIIMSNNGNFSLNPNKVAEAFFESSFESEDEEEKQKKSKNAGKVDLSVEQLEVVAGKYQADDIGLVIDYKIEGTSLIAHFQGQSPKTMEPTSHISFDYQGVEAKVDFTLSDAGKATAAIHHQNGQALNLAKLAPYDPTTEDLKEFTGNFFCDELQVVYKLLLDDDEKLIIQVFNLEDIKLSAVEKDTFSGSAFFLGEVAFQRNDLGTVDGFLASNGRTKNVKFVKQ